VVSYIFYLWCLAIVVLLMMLIHEVHNCRRLLRRLPRQLELWERGSIEERVEAIERLVNL